MTNKKISALTSATTPLAGTETLPIVQSGATVKVSVANLTAGRDATGASFKATTSVGAGTDPGVGVYAVGDYPVGFFTFKRTSVNTAGVAAVGFVASDAKTAGDGVAVAWRALNSSNAEKSYATQSARIVTATAGGENSSFVTNVQSSGSSLEMQTIDGTGISTPGNFIPSTAAKGINFTANTPAAGMTSQLLNWYEEGTWTPTFTSTGATFDYSSRTATYVRMGKLVYASFQIAMNSGASGTVTNAVLLTGLPFTAAEYGGLNNAWQNLALVPTGIAIGTSIYLYGQGTVTQLTPTSAGLITSGRYFAGVMIYSV